MTLPELKEKIKLLPFEVEVKESHVKNEGWYCLVEGNLLEGMHCVYTEEDALKWVAKIFKLDSLSNNGISDAEINKLTIDAFNRGGKINTDLIKNSGYWTKTKEYDKVVALQAKLIKFIEDLFTSKDVSYSGHIHNEFGKILNLVACEAPENLKNQGLSNNNSKEYVNINELLDCEMCGSMCYEPSLMKGSPSISTDKGKK